MKLDVGAWYLGHERPDYGENIHFALFRLNEDMSRSLVTFDGEKANISRVEAGNPIPHPSFFLNHSQQQAVMNTLWEIGIRPNYRRYDEEIKMKDEHIGLLQRVLDKLLGDKGMPA